MKYYIYNNEELLGEVSANKGLNIDEIMYALGYDRFDWNGHESEEHGDYINKDGKEVYADDMWIEEQPSLDEIYKRTMNNCKFYEQQYNKYHNIVNKKHLLNEIGTLRGVAYCMEVATEYTFIDDPINDPDFIHFIGIQEQYLWENEQ